MDAEAPAAVDAALLLANHSRSDAGELRIIEHIMLASGAFDCKHASMRDILAFMRLAAMSSGAK